MRTLVVTWAGGGNVPPAVEIHARLRARGHAVRIVGHESVRESFGPGADFVTFDRAPDFVDSRPVDDTKPEPKSPIGAFAHLRDRLLLGPADRFALDVIDQIDELRPDVLVVDFMLVGALVAGEARRVPTVALMHTIYSLPRDGVPPLGMGFTPAAGALGRARDRVVSRVTSRLWNHGLGDLNRARHAVGLSQHRDVFDQLNAVDHVLVTSSRTFDFDAADDEMTSYVGLLRHPRCSAGNWQHSRTDLAHLPLVVASYSTTDQGQLQALRRVAAALGRLPVRGLVTCGPAIQPSDVDAPGNVDVQQYVDHNTVLNDASLLVSHGGHGSVLGAVRRGVPVLCIPQGRDQHDVAARVTHLGAGAALPRRSRPRRIARTVERLLADPKVRAQARDASRRIELEHLHDPVDILESLAAAYTAREGCSNCRP